MNYIILDTNTLHISSFNAYKGFKLNSFFEDLKGKIELNDVEESFQILIPEIVFNELLQHQVQEFNKDIEILKLLKDKFIGLNNFTIKIPDKIDYDKHLNIAMSEFKSRYGIQTIKIHSDKNSFDNIIEKALQKLPPFEGKNKQSDKGFKDALIWESIMQYASENVGDYYFLTYDKIFNNDLTKKTLLQEFNSRNSNSSIEFINNKDEIIQQIEKFSGEQYKLHRKNNIESQLKDYLPELETQVVEEIFNDFSINSITNYKYDSYEFVNTFPYLSKVNDISYEFSLVCILKAVKPSSKISLNVTINFLLTTVSSKDNNINIIEIDNIDASTEDGDNLDLITNPFKKELTPVSNELFEECETTNNSTTKIKANSLENNDTICNLNDSDKKVVEHIILNGNFNSKNAQLLDKLYLVISDHLTVDWSHFENKTKALKIAVKKELKKNNLSNAEHIAVEIVDKLLNNYR
ncbi:MULTISPECIES: PIN domain-containing protein [Staphylococcus]|nr:MULTISPECIES: PIN domain-containing protein [Staphylococcus]AJC94874.1 hypothetical protein SHYC_00225 [Staphylococcus hyicus]ALN77624.1 DUF4935 domain-containing protein [Staphylococcus agnetis]MCQ9291608.1 PIN domain-containing protein [Staphylococcus hyicus]MCQ9306849.1 PIN domain-containing protein [Staphylococcus hyicus]MCQ9309512.1 PIN domain-containing protein [Staphylococcus hyicus]